MKGREDAQRTQVLTRRRRRERELRSAPTKPTGGLESPTGGHHHEAAIKASAAAELTPPAQIGLPLTGGDGEYPGPFSSITTGQPRLAALGVPEGTVAPPTPMQVL
jgi:hypothetical protein